MMERALANARHPRRRCRAVLLLAGLAFAGWAAHGQETACDQVHESRRAQCLKVMACMMVDDDEIRRACIDAAQRPPAQQQPEQTTREQAVQEATALERSRQARQEQPAGEAAAPVQKPEEPVLQEQQVEPVIWEEDRRPRADATPPPPSREPASEFSGTVSRIYQSILDRQLIAIDGAYLFESDRAAHARLEVGERVEVEKASSRFWTGRKWRITGPSRTPIVAFRVRCESEDIRADDRRKCGRMLDRRP